MKISDLVQVLAWLPQDIETDIELSLWRNGEKLILSDFHQVEDQYTAHPVDCRGKSKRAIYEMLKEKENA